MTANNPLVPTVARVQSIREDTPDVKTFQVVDINGKKPFEHMPGQCAMISVPGVGEALFSITSSPTQKQFLEFSIKKCGCVTQMLHSIEPGQMITLRGPYGRPFPVKGEFLGKDLLFIAGGIGIAPLRSVINYVADNRADYGSVQIVYGARTAADLVHIEEIRGDWASQKDFTVSLTVDRATEGWSGHVGFVPDFLKELSPDNRCTAVLCGPPVMIKFTLARLLEMGFEKSNIYTTLELKMKCGVGKCGRCNVGDKMVCKDGPVFCMTELDCLPDEY